MAFDFTCLQASYAKLHSSRSATDRRVGVVHVRGSGNASSAACINVPPSAVRAVFVAANGSYLDGAMGRRVAEAFGSLAW